jgi:DNA polymerase III sliding clamp (beta) subunit (PCNA family)
MTDIIEHDNVEELKQTVVPGFTIPGHTLRDMLTAGLIAVGKDEGLPSLTGVRLEWSETVPELKVVSTDRYRLMVASADMDNVGTFGDDVAVSIHRKDVADLVKALPKLTRGRIPEMVRVTVLGDSVLVEGEGWSRTFTALQGEFPKYRSLLPREDTYAPVERISFNPKFLGDIAKIPGERNMPVTLRFVDERRPMVGTVRGDNGVSEYLYLLMPVRLTS